MEKTMTNRANYRGSLAILCVHALVVPLAAYGREKPPLDWDNVRKLHDGNTIQVTLFNNQIYRGKVTGLVTADTLPLKTKATPMSIPKQDIKTIITYKAAFANPGIYIGIGGVLLASGGGLAGSLKDINTLENGSLPKGNSGTKLIVAGIIAAVAGIAVYILAGKPRTIYEGKPAPAIPNQ
jgi:hypothetical protein